MKANIRCNRLSPLSSLGNVIKCERFDRKMTMSFMKSKVLLSVLNNSLLVPSLSITPDKNLTTFGSASALWFNSKTERFQKIVVMHISLSDACSSSCSKDPNRATSRIRFRGLKPGNNRLQTRTPRDEGQYQMQQIKCLVFTWQCD